MAAEFFKQLIANGHFSQKKLLQLRGKNLACWCPIGAPCHADVLLELANAPIDGTTTDGQPALAPSTNNEVTPK